MQSGNSRPINKTAALVVSGGQSYNFKETSPIKDSPFPLPTRPLGQNEKEDLSGRKIGRLSVVGRSATDNGKWVCRCSCGTYILRKSKSLLAESGKTCPCHQCERLAVSKKSEYYRRTGKDICTTEFY